VYVWQMLYVFLLSGLSVGMDVYAYAYVCVHWFKRIYISGNVSSVLQAGNLILG
jgi:hypothetical protein